jgi:hypothetical protein
MAIATKKLYVAGESISVGDSLFMAHETAPGTYISGIIPGRVYRTKKDVRARSVYAMCIGFAATAASVGQTLDIILVGQLSGLSGITAGMLYQPSTALGGIEEYIPGAWTQDQPIALGLSTTSILVLENPWYVKERALSVGGYNGSRIAAIQGFKVSDETVVTSFGTLLTGSTDTQTPSSSTTLYVTGGTTAAYGQTTYIEIFSFSSLTCSAISGVLPTVLQMGGWAQSTTKGYTLGGTTGTAYTGSMTNAVRTIDFSNNSVSSLAGTLTAATTLGFAESAPTKMYMCGGYIASVHTSNVEVMTYSVETFSNLSSALLVGRRNVATMMSSTSLYTPLGGGSSVAMTPSTIEKMSLSNETFAFLTYNPLLLFGNGGASTSIGGYMICGWTTTYYGGAQGFRYSNETPYITNTSGFTTTAGNPQVVG